MPTPHAAKARDLTQVVKDLKRQVRQLNSRVVTREQLNVSGGDFTITGGDLTVDGGNLVALDDDGSTLLRVGPQTLGDRGVSIYRDTGEPVFEVNKADETLPQRWVMRDSSGNIIVAENAFGVGLSRPRLTYGVVPVADTPTPVMYGPYGIERVTSADPFTNVFEVRARMQNNYWTPTIMVSASDATTTAEVRAVNVLDGAVLNEFFLATDWGDTTTGTSWAEFTPALVLPGSVDATFHVAIQVARTAGTGDITVAVPASYGA